MIDYTENERKQFRYNEFGRYIKMPCRNNGKYRA